MTIYFCLYLLFFNSSILYAGGLHSTELNSCCKKDIKETSFHWASGTLSKYHHPWDAEKAESKEEAFFEREVFNKKDAWYFNFVLKKIGLPYFSFTPQEKKYQKALTQLITEATSNPHLSSCLKLALENKIILYKACSECAEFRLFYLPETQNQNALIITKADFSTALRSLENLVSLTNEILSDYSDPAITKHLERLNRLLLIVKILEKKAS